MLVHFPKVNYFNLKIMITWKWSLQQLCCTPQSVLNVLIFLDFYILTLCYIFYPEIKTKTYLWFRIIDTVPNVQKHGSNCRTSLSSQYPTNTSSIPNKNRKRVYFHKGVIFANFANQHLNRKFNQLRLIKCQHVEWNKTQTCELV